MVDKLSFILLLSCSLLLSCDADLITPQESDFTFSFTQSAGGLNVWTAPATRRIKSDDVTPPSATGSSLPISCAMEELESFQIIIAPTSVASITLTWTGFSNMGPTSWVDVGVAQFSPVSQWGQTGADVTDLTNPVSSGSTITLSSSQPTVLWITLYVPGDGTTSGQSTATFHLGSVTIPVALYVFNFKLQRTPHFQTYMMSQPLITVYNLTAMDAWKEVYLQHRMASDSVDWPDGFSWGVGWDCDSQSLIDANSPPSTTQCIWANGCLSRRYAQGKGGEWAGQQYADWIDEGYPMYNPVRTDNGRPDNFCGVECNDPTGSGWFCSSAYEAAWGKYLLALQTQFQNQGFDLSKKIKGFWYTQNEPQNYNDYTISAYLCSIARQYAPELPIMLSREARPDIAERAEYDNCSYDIWMAWMYRYTAAYTRMHQYKYGEVSWIYSLDTDGMCTYPGQCGPAFAPAISQTGDNGAEDPVATNEGPHYRVISWVGWANRVTGWGYYHDDIFWDTRGEPYGAPSRPRISAALLREGFEDYEYLYIANGNKYPGVYVKEDVDDTAMSVGYAVGSWLNDPTAIHALRHQLGLKIEGSRPDFPYLELTPTRPYQNYYIDFQDTSAGPIAPFDFNGVTWLPIGWDQYNVSKGYGWNSQYMGVPNAIQTGQPILNCIYTWNGNEVEATVCYDDYNAPDEFHFALAPGVYNVTVGIGWPGACRGDTEFVSINNVVIRNTTCDPCCQDVREYSGIVDVYPGANGAGIIMTFGNNEGYTILSYMMIETVQGGGTTGLPSSSSTTGSAAPPTASPSQAPSKSPTANPSAAPSSVPTGSPSQGPTQPPSQPPSQIPTQPPTQPPTKSPTQSPSQAPTAGSSATVCAGNIGEGQTMTLTCPQAGQVITSVQFASYGTPQGSCGSYAVGSCDAATSTSVFNTNCLNKPSCSFVVGNSLFNDPCSGTVKHFDVQVTCTATAVPTATVAPNPYLGCFVDSATRDLSYQQGSSDSQTVELCRSACGKLGYTYAGLQYYSQCFCGNTYDTQGQASDSDCNTACKGNNQEMCGGPWRNSVYQTAGYNPQIGGVNSASALAVGAVLLLSAVFFLLA